MGKTLQLSNEQLMTSKYGMSKMRPEGPSLYELVEESPSLGGSNSH